MTTGFASDKDGIYPGVPFGEYLSAARFSSHAASAMAVSPEHCRYWLDHPRDPTRSTTLGSAEHTACLEPDLFENSYVVPQKCEAATKLGTERCSNTGSRCRNGHWYCRIKGHDDKDAGPLDRRPSLPQADLDKCKRMRDAIWNHSAARFYLESKGLNEASGLWTLKDGCPEWRTGSDEVSCKLRVDHWGSEEHAIVDLKTTSGLAKRDEIEKTFWTRGYYRQAGSYSRAFEVLGEKIDHFLNVVVESNEPYGVSVFRAKDDVTALGYEHFLRYARTYQDCLRKGSWPGYSEKIQDLDLPTWAWTHDR